MRSLPRRVTSIALSSLAAAWLSAHAADASAQAAAGISLDRLSPSERGSAWFEEDSLDMRGNLRPAVGLVGEYADRPLIIQNAAGTTVAAPLKDQLTLHLGASLTLADRFRVGLDIPFSPYSDGTPGAVGAVSYPATSSAGMGDVRLSGDMRAAGAYGSPFSLAVGVALFLPTGSASAYLGDGQLRVLPRVAIAGDAGILSYAAHLGVMVRTVSDAFPNYPTGTEGDLGASVGVRLASRRLLIGPEVYGSTVISSGSAIFSARQTPLEGLLGVHYSVGEAWRVGGGAAMGLSKGFGEPLARGVVMVEWAPPYVAPIGDRDHDWVPDNVDACPDVPGIKTTDPKTNGCPPPDRDKDGVPDADDACPDVPGLKSDDPKSNGCPPDRDHDGIPDSEDACPDVPGVRMDDKTTSGCQPDSDKDGIPDFEDACPDVPGERTSDPKTNGCPNLDHDKDGIPNAQDACPEVPGPSDPDPKRNGCPEVYIQDDVLKVLDPVKFTAAGAILLTDAPTKRGLDAVLAFLAAHPDVKRLRVEGHTDNTGDANANRALSAKRAAAVVAWLARGGVAKARLTSMGVGGDSPIADNSTEEGRRANERIEIHVEP